jgi:RNA-binding protein
VLSGKQKRYLRGLGHHLDPVVQIGKEGLSQGLVGAVDAALTQHELIKVRIAESVGDDRHAVAESLAEATESQLAQVLGRTLLLYRRREEEPEIRLPE